MSDLSVFEIVSVIFKALFNKSWIGLNIAIGAKENKMESFNDFTTFFLPKKRVNPHKAAKHGVKQII